MALRDVAPLIVRVMTPECCVQSQVEERRSSSQREAGQDRRQPAGRSTQGCHGYIAHVARRRFSTLLLASVYQRLNIILRYCGNDTFSRGLNKRSSVSRPTTQISADISCTTEVYEWQGCVHNVTVRLLTVVFNYPPALTIVSSSKLGSQDRQTDRAVSRHRPWCVVCCWAVVSCRLWHGWPTS